MIRITYPIFSESHWIQEDLYLQIKESIKEHGYKHIPYPESKELNKQITLLSVQTYSTIVYVLFLTICSKFFQSTFDNTILGPICGIIGISIFMGWMTVALQYNKVDDAFYLPRRGYILQLARSVEESDDYLSFIKDFYTRYPLQRRYDENIFTRPIAYDISKDKLEYLNLETDVSWLKCCGKHLIIKWKHNKTYSEDM